MLQVRGVSKTFFGQVALSHVDLAVAFGEVHALVGQNGSGKSTLIKILSGYHQPDPGGLSPNEWCKSFVRLVVRRANLFVENSRPR